MKKILVPTDFSHNADNALDHAVQLAKVSKAKIIIMHACDLLELTFKDRVALKKEYNKNIIKEAREKLHLYRDSIMKTEKILIQTRLYEGLISETILYAAQVQKADLIVMGTLGKSGMKEKIFGSKTAAVIAKTTVPVLAIPLLSEWKRPETICLAINKFKEANAAVLQPLLSLTAATKANLNIAKFTDTDTAGAIDYLAVEREGNNFAEKLQELTKLNIKFVQLTGSRFNKIMDNYISNENVDMLAMITHKRNRVSSIFRRSMTKKMSWHINIPLLALPVSLRSSDKLI